MGVLNTVLMSALERTREFGVMRALGTRPAIVCAKKQMSLEEMRHRFSLKVVHHIHTGNCIGMLSVTWWNLAVITYLESQLDRKPKATAKQ